ncbi:MAG TPA: hypothetical protein ENI39_07340 [Anaerolineae bacterium]|nr:hypothetical protein [Anaerolineae bacterium]
MTSERVVGMARNEWTASIGIDGRHGPEHAHDLMLTPVVELDRHIPLLSPLLPFPDMVIPLIHKPLLFFDARILSVDGKTDG